MARPFKNRRGSVLPIVFAFSLIAVITVIAFVSGQYMIARPALLAPTDFQALLNARSGIWKGLELLYHPPAKDTLKTINTLDTLFNSGLFGKPTGAISNDTEALTPDGDPLSVPLFASDSFGACTLAVSYRGCFEVLRSKGAFRNREKNAVVTLGGVFAPQSDTVLFLENNPPLQSPVRGKIHYGPWDTAGALRTGDLTKFISQYGSEMSDSVDTAKPSPPLLIQHNVEFDTIPKVVNGPLFIDGTHFDLAWKCKKRIIVHGDVQITGTVSLEGMDFLATGEIKLLDKARLRDVFLFGQKTISIGDKAVFSGTAMTRANILVFGAASVQRRSLLVVVQQMASATVRISPSSPQKPIAASASSSRPAIAASAASSRQTSAASGRKTKAPVFSVTFAELSTVDATVVTLGDSLGIKIDRNAIVTGLLRTHGAVSLDGKIYGRMYASKFVDGTAVASGNPAAALAVIHGTVLPLDDLAGYFFPFFMGKLSIIDWREE